MSNHHPHNDILESKLRQLPGADANHLWNGMQAILDKQMPEKKKRPGIFWWLFTKRTLYVSVTALASAITAYAFLYTPAEKTKANYQQPDATTPGIRTEQVATNSGTAINVKEEKENNISVANLRATQQKRQESAAVPAEPAWVANKSFHNNLATQQRKDLPSEFKSTGGKLPAAPIQTAGINQANKSTTVANNSISVYRMDAAAPEKAIANSIEPLRSYQPAASHPEAKPFSIIQTHTTLDAAAVAKAKAAYRKYSRERGIYAGLMAGLDLSSVHFTSLKAGATKGVIMGYAFNKKWSVETGVFWDSKRYHANGEYFQPSGYILPAGINMLAVKGENKMYEWPVNIRYTIVPDKNRLFATAGLSSYFMKQENYEYEYEQNGQYSKSYASYSNQTKNMFSVINLSMGYTWSLGTIGDIRVEPYVKLPVKKLGFNNMPIMSTGINIGFTKWLSH